MFFSFCRWLLLVYVCVAKLPQNQIDALVEFYHALDGPNWNSHFINNNRKHINCTWNITYLQTTHEFCHPITASIKYQMPFCGLIPVAVKWVGRHNNARRPWTPIANATWCKTLTGIDMSNMGLSGTIPDSFGNLSNVSVLRFGDDHGLTGSLPQTICNLKHLNWTIFINISITAIPQCFFHLNVTSMHLIGLPSLQSPLNMLDLMGNYQLSLQWLTVMAIPMLTQPLPSSLCNLTNLRQLDIVYLNITGTLFDCFHKMKALRFLDMIYLPHLKGSLPPSLGYANVTVLFFYNIPNLVGSIPRTICNSKTIRDVTFYQLQNIEIQDPCFGNATQLNILYLAELPKLTAIPHDLCNLKDTNLSSLVIANNTNLVGTVPKCFGELRGLTGLALSNNSLSGDLPQFKPRNVMSLFLNNNNFNGNLDDIFVINDSVKYRFSELLLHSNDFYCSDISKLMKYWFTNIYTFNKTAANHINWLNFTKNALKQQYLSTLTLFNNPRIHGVIPDPGFDDNVAMVLQYFLAHNTDITGSIPMHLSFEHTTLSALTLYNNRMSCDLPPQFISEHFNITNNKIINASKHIKYLNKTRWHRLVLASNLFRCLSSKLPKWVNSPFGTAQNLYITEFQLLESDLIVVFAFICLELWILKIIYKLYYKVDIVNDSDANTSFSFTDNVGKIVGDFEDYKLLICVVILCIIYALQSTYYDSKCTPFLTWFSLCWYYTANNDDNPYENNPNHFQNWLLMLIFIAFNIMVIITIIRLYSFNIRQSRLNSDYSMNSKLLVVSRFSFRGKSNENHNIHPTKITKCDHILQVLWITFLCLTFLCGVTFTVFYVICESLPNNNILSLNDDMRDLVINGVSFVLAFNASIVVPHLVDSLACYVGILTTHRTPTILCLRTLTTIVIPCISSILLLQDCGRSWVIFWSDCHGDNASKYFYVGEYFISLNWQGLVANGYHPSLPYTQLITPSDVCDGRRLYDIDWSKCIRAFMYRWCQVVMLKIIIMIFMPMFVIFIKTLRQKICAKLCCIKYFRNKYSKNRTVIDMEYCMLINKLELVITFSLITPLILPITLVAIESNKYFYKIMIDKMKWDVCYYQNVLSFPIQFLVLGVVFEQLLISSFSIFCIQNYVMSAVLIGCLLLMDGLLVYKYIYVHKQTHCKRRYLNIT